MFTLNRQSIRFFWQPQFGDDPYPRAPKIGQRNGDFTNGKVKKDKNLPYFKLKIKGNKRQRTLLEILNERKIDHEQRRGKEIILIRKDKKTNLSSEQKVGGITSSVVPQKGDVIVIV